MTRLKPITPRRRWLALLSMLVLALLLTPPAEAAPGGPAEPPPPSEDEGLPGKPAAWDIIDDTHDISPTGADARTRAAAAAPTDCLGSPTREIRYTSDGVIHLAGCGQSFTLSDVAAAPKIGIDKLELVDASNKIWLLKVKLKVEEGATLSLVGGAAGDVSWLRLRSDSASGVWLRAENGALLIKDTRVTSWDPGRNTYDTDPSVAADGSGGRAYIATRSVLTKGRATAPPTACDIAGGSREPYEGRMDIANSELAYLGYYAGESYGVVWKVYYKSDPNDPGDTGPPGRQLYALADVFGDVSGSSFHHNYFGSYTFGAYCMRWTGNTFASNVMYGLDPHDDSDYLTISGNTFHDNGDHGVICSVECDHLVIANNQSYNNQHGIMIHRNVNGALIEGNTIHDNRQAGIAIFDSHDAIVRNNTVSNNAESAIRLSVGSSRNLIENNTLTGLGAGASGNGYVIYTYKGSDPPSSGDGLPKNNTFRGNRLTGYKSPLVKLGSANDNLFEANTIAGPANDFALTSATGNRMRDGQLNVAVRVALDSTSAMTLEDSRGYVWLLSKSGLSAVAEPAGTSLRLTAATAGSSVTATTIDLAVRPASGQVTVQPTAWSATSKSWTERASSAPGPVAHTAGGLQAGACYTVKANGASIGIFRAGGDGRIAFTYSGSYANAVTFAIALAQCSVPDAAVPSHNAYLPFVQG